jgi:hypothetical protein
MAFCLRPARCILNNYRSTATDACDGLPAATHDDAADARARVSILFALPVCIRSPVLSASSLHLLQEIRFQPLPCVTDYSRNVGTNRSRCPCPCHNSRCHSNISPSRLLNQCILGHPQVSGSRCWRVVLVVSVLADACGFCHRVAYIKICLRLTCFCSLCSPLALEYLRQECLQERSLLCRWTRGSSWTRLAARSSEQIRWS